MAIAIPFIASAMGASTLVAAGIGLAFQVSGVNDKINKAASKVFGEDLVKVANIAGAVYGAWNGGFSLDPAKQFMGFGEAAAGGATNVVDSVASLEAVSPLSEASWMADGAANTAAITEAATGVQPSVFQKLDFSQSNPIDAGQQTGTDLITQKQSGLDARVSASNETSTSDPAKPTTAGFEQKATTPLASSANATAANATASNATTGQQSLVEKLVGINRSTPSATAANATAPQPSVFDKVFSKVGDKTIAGLIQGAAAGYGNAQQARLAEDRARVNPTSIRGYTYRPTV